MRKLFTLSATERLKSRKQINHLFATGKKLLLPPFRVVYELQHDEEGEACLQFGIGASKRNFKKAVDRNRIKRLGREAWRLQKATLLQALQEQNKKLHVFFIYTGKELPDFEEVSICVGKAIQKLILTSKA